MALNPSLTGQSLPLARQTVTLKTLHTIKVYNRTFQRVEYACYLADILVRVRGAVSQRYEIEIDLVMEAVQACLASPQQMLDDLNHRFAKLIKRAHLEAAAVEMVYSAPAEETLTVRTPIARQYIGLLEYADEVCRKLDGCWYHGLVKTSDQLKQGRAIERRLLRAANQISTLARHLARRVSDRDEASVADRVMTEDYKGLLRRYAADAGLDLDADTMTAVEQAELAETEALSEALQGGPIAPAVIETLANTLDSADETHDDLTEDAMTPSSSEAATESTTTPGLRKLLGGLGS